MKMNMLGLCALCLLASCDTKQQVASLEKKLSDTQSQISSALQSNIEAVKKDITEVKDKQSSIEHVQERDRSAYLSPGSHGYSVIRFDLGLLAVRLASVKPYAKGSKVTLEIGNPLSVTIKRLNATVEWGKVDDKGVPLNEQTKSKEVTLKQSLQGGYITKVPLNLEGIPPKELGFVRIKEVNHEGIRFLKK